MSDASKTAARLIAEMMETRSWSIPHDYADHPILGPAMLLHDSVYREKRSGGIIKAIFAADEAAVQYILDACNQ